MPSNWSTKIIELSGGLILNRNELLQGIAFSGSLVEATNFEPSQKGGYRRISGYGKYDPDPVPGTGEIKGLKMHDGSVIAARGTDLYISSGSGWTKINTDTRQASPKVRGASYNWTAPTTVFVDGVNPPVKYQGTAYTVLTNAPVGADIAAVYRKHLWFAKNNHLICSAPYNDEDYDAANGALDINVGDTITGLMPWRNSLFVFCQNSIKRIVGTSYADFQFEPVAERIGCLHPDTVQEVGGDLFFLAQDGIRTIAGTDRIGDLNLGALSRPLGQKVTKFTNAPGSYVSSVVLASKSQYRLFRSDAGTPADASIGILGGIREGVEGGQALEWFDLQGIKLSCADSAYYQDDEYVVHGGFDGYVYRQEFGHTFDGNAVYAVLRTPYMTLDDPAIRKTLYTLNTFALAEGQCKVMASVKYDYDKTGTIQPDPFTVMDENSTGATYDDPESIYDDNPLDIYDAMNTPVYRNIIEGSGDAVSFTFYSDGTDYPYSINAIFIEYNLGDRA